jgi:Transposase and inactivated derivatives, IS30 family
MRTFKHLTPKQKSKLEGMLEGKLTQEEMARRLGVSQPTISREIRRGLYYKRDGSTWKDIRSYSCDISHDKYLEGRKYGGASLKIGNDLALLRFIEDMILNHKYSPMAALVEIRRKKLKFKTTLSLSTIYNYIRSGVFPNLQLSDLPMPHNKKGKKKRVQKRQSRGNSIEERPDLVDDREEFGHWEMDSVVGKKGSKKALLVLTERKTRKEIIEPLKNHTAREVVRALNRIERDYGDKIFRMVFQTITVDNGMEFSDFEGIERSRRNKTKRTVLYYCHAYSSYERGSNENLNKMIRRFVPKGTNFDNRTRSEIKEIEKWMNNYPRQMFDYGTAEELYQSELTRLIS